MYNRVGAGTIAALARIVGEENVLAGPQHAERVEPYTHDETVGLAAEPEVVVLATSAQQVSDIMRLAQAARVPVTPRGAGYGLSGGAVPVCGGIVLSLERMNRILEIDQGNLMVTVEPGVITGNIHRAVEAEGRLLADVELADIHGQFGFNFQHAAISREESKKFLD